MRLLELCVAILMAYLLCYSFIVTSVDKLDIYHSFSF